MPDSTAVVPGWPAALPPSRSSDQAPFVYDKLGAGVVIYSDRLELTTGALWKRRTHVIPLRAIVGVSVTGLGGHTLIVRTPGGAYRIEVGMGAASKIREKILSAMARDGGR